MESKSILDITRDGYKQYGDYVNNNRHIPLIFDGLKPSYRRTIFGALQLCGNSNKYIKSSQLSGHVIGNYHPHGDASVNGVINQLVNSGIFEGQGNFGGATMNGEIFEAAASRYTEVHLNPHWHKIFNDLLPYVEWEDSYIGVKMPSYLPTPIPLSLLFGSIGIGFGVGCLIPNFSAKSLVEAFKEDNPYKLCPAYNNITFDYDLCDFENMWNAGYAKISYVPKLHMSAAPDSPEGFYIESDTKFIVPNIPEIKDKINEGRLFSRDESDINGDRLYIGRFAKLHEDMEYFMRYAYNQCHVTDVFRLYVTDGKTTRLISLKDWIKFTYNRYLSYVQKMKEAKASKIEKEIRLCELIPKVGKILQENPNADEPFIVSSLPDANPSDIHTCLGKPIRKLMKSEYSSEIASLNNQLNSVNSIDPESYTSSIINNM